MQGLLWRVRVVVSGFGIDPGGAYHFKHSGFIVSLEMVHKVVHIYKKGEPHAARDNRCQGAFD